MRPNRVVIGTEDEQARAILEDLYRPLYLIETPIVSTRRRAAELIKYASNAFLAVKISYINEMADLCEKLGADVHDVAKGMGLDQRIGRKFLHPGPGYGGSCFPKDTRAIQWIAEEQGIDLKIVGAAIGVNDVRPGRMLERIRESLGGSLKGRTIGLLGLTFKPNTDDLRESPAIAILDGLLEGGARVRAYDPVGMEGTAATPRDGVTYCRDEWDAVAGVDAVVVATECNQFRGMDAERLRAAVASPVLFDFRNIFEPAVMKAKGFTYVGVGRS
jgi:UDPglucose 6-dehydrogenase